ncbi:P-loop containing nucleoside triphosphate hydrolase protein [Clavulina sp. PMI_390]|nr:P-loop containing nucleoside triphosphate hydrolase protein [Clavulina sp. PMI_390]
MSSWVGKTSIGAEPITPSIFLAAWIYASRSLWRRSDPKVPYRILSIHCLTFLSVCENVYRDTLRSEQHHHMATFSTSVMLSIIISTLNLAGIIVMLNMPVHFTPHSPARSTDPAYDALPPAREDFLTLFQWITFNWIADLVYLGTQRPLQDSDVWQLSSLVRAKVVMTKFRTFLVDSKLLRRIVAANSVELGWDLVLTLFTATLTVIQPFLLNLILRELTVDTSLSPGISTSFPFLALLDNPSLQRLLPDHGLRLAYVYAGISFLARLLKAEIEANRIYFARRAITRIETELIGSIYEKALVRKDITGSIAVAQEDGEEGAGQSQGASVGKVVSLITVDTAECGNMVNTMNRLYELPIFAVGSGLLLINLMGWTAFLGLAIFPITTPLLKWISQTRFSYLKQYLAARDVRVNEMNQVIQGIRFLKFFAWEAKWIERVMAKRKRELALFGKFLWFICTIIFIWDVLPLVVTLISFSSFLFIAHGKLTVAIAFPVISGLEIMTKTINAGPLFLDLWLKTMASLQRIEAYLNEDEVPRHLTWRADPSPIIDQESSAIGFDNASFAWDTASPDTPSSIVAGREGFRLQNLTISFHIGAINLIAGPTGSGKSSLLAALLGEMSCVSGKTFLPKSHTRVDPMSGLRRDVSFCAQRPWLQHMTIRDNITFGSAYDEGRMQRVLRACQLLPDLAVFIDRGHIDLTEIGEGGVSLSGGQKARVALARAVYSRSATVILDDVLSAVDSHTASRLIKECFLGPIMKDRTIIIATHHVDRILPHCSWVVRLENGLILKQGPSEKLDAAELDPDRKVNTQAEEIADIAIPTGENKVDSPAPKALVEKEKKSEGHVLLKMYRLYIGAASWTFVGGTVFCILVQYTGSAAQKFWVRYWGESYQAEGLITDALPTPNSNVLPYLAVYIGIQAVTALFTAGLMVPAIFATLRAARKLHQQMLLSVIRTPIRWFDQTPSGRILNRFSKGLFATLIEFWPTTTIAMGVACLTTIVVVIYVTPLFFFPLVAIIFFQVWASRGYVEVSRDLRRIESTFRSPIIASFSEILVGVTTVRAFGVERFFVDNLYKRLDRVQAAGYYYWTVNRWMMFQLNVLGSFVVGVATLIAIATGVSPGIVGIIVASTSGFVMDLYQMMQSYTYLQQAMNSIERVNEYLELPKERGAFNITSESGTVHFTSPEGTMPVPVDWPRSEGGIDVRNLTVRYAADLEPVIHGVSFQPREKIGIIGRTGSGKSTLAMSFFRFVDSTSLSQASAPQGNIVIDGIDIDTISLHDLRSRLTIIPQDAMLFSGTLRDNLDPFSEHSDDECIQALKSAQLPVAAATASPLEIQDDMSGPLSAESPKVFALHSPISENGNNLSGGQRQLVALARAILRRSGVVIMDESTSSVDFETDQRIQRIIRQEFKESIMLTIAHRLETIMDYDRVMVLEDGKIVEFDSPAVLMEKSGSKFHSMFHAISNPS